MAYPIYNAEDGAKSAIRNADLAPIFYLEIADLERTPRETDLPTFVIVDLGAGRYVKIPLRIECIWLPPMHRIEAGTGVWRADIGVALKGAKLSLWRRPIGACSGIVDSRDAASVR